MTEIEETYPSLINSLMEYIDKIKKKDRTTPLIDIITDFGMKNDIEMEYIGDAIQNDIYFKSFVEKDCKYHNFILSKNKNKKIDEW